MSSHSFSYVSADMAHKILEAIALAPYGFAIWQSELPLNSSSELTLRFINEKGAHPSDKTPEALANHKMSECLPEVVGTSLDYAIREAMSLQVETEVLVRTVPHPGGVERVFRNTIIPVEPGLVMATFVEVTKESILERDYRTERRTGLATRPYFDDTLRNMYDSQKTDSKSFGIFFMDIDKFKEVNDTYGHICGDEVLSEVARRLRLIQPAPALIARWGGDEFAILTDWDEEGNVRLGEEILRSFKAPFLWGSVEIDLNISVGYLTKNADDEIDFRSAMSLVDGAMYRAKQAGGNRVESAADIAR